MCDGLTVPPTNLSALCTNPIAIAAPAKQQPPVLFDVATSAKAAPGQERVLYPGLLEYEEARERREHGTPLHTEVIEWFGTITSELGVAPLATP
jgi:LDH2 family malate/lactate/ureidoglycolate dehydrogenase